jgi:hypothetical protein
VQRLRHEDEPEKRVRKTGRRGEGGDRGRKLETGGEGEGVRMI